MGRASPFLGSPLGRVWAASPSRLWSRGGSRLQVKSASLSPARSPRSPVLSVAEVVSRGRTNHFLYSLQIYQAQLLTVSV